MLDRLDVARGEALAVADAVDLVDDRHFGIAAEQEIGVQRMRRPRRDVLDGAAGGGARPGAEPGAAQPARGGQAAPSAWPMTWPPNTRCQRDCGERPRNRFTSSGSRSRMSRTS